MKPNKIKEIIENGLTDTLVHISNPRKDMRHFKALVISDIFIGMPLIKQHKTVLDSLKEVMNRELHSLAIKTFTKESWEQEKENYDWL